MDSKLAPGALAIDITGTPPADQDLWLALHRGQLAVVAAQDLEGLRNASVAAALELSGARAGRVLFHWEAEGFLPPGQTAVSDHAGHVFPITWAGENLGYLELGEFDPAREARPWVPLLCEVMGACLAKTQLFEQLELIKREWQAMLDGMVDGVYVSDQHGTVIRANRALAGILGSTIPGILGRGRDELWAQLPDYHVIRPWHNQDPGTAGSPRVTEFSFGRPERIYVEMAFDLHTSAGPSRQSLCVLHDVTESRRLQEQLLQSEKLAALGELTSGVAHELNNPLATVVGYAELLELDPGLPESTRRKVVTIQQEATRASHIVQNLLAYARKSAPEKSFVSINDVLEATLEMRRYQLQSEDIQLTTHFSEDLPLVWADRLQLQQVVLNIVNNAVQAMRSRRGSGEIRLWSGPAVLQGNAAVRVIIEDNGPGIAPDHLRRVFDPFFTTKPTGEGTGLGMSIAMRIVSNHDGLLWAESHVGSGTRFIMELPASGAANHLSNVGDDTEASGAPGSGSLEAEGQALDTGKPHTTEAGQVPESIEPPLAWWQQSGEDGGASGSSILVVDDEEPVVTLISEILIMDGHRVTPAFNGAEAIALLRAHDFDLILSDVRMPAVGGPTFFEILQTTRPDLLPRVIFVTGDTMSRSTQEFLREAGRPVLAKPFDPEKLLNLVNATLQEASSGEGA